MTIPLPELDPRDEDTVVAQVIDSLPAEITDRSRSAPEVVLVEAMGAFYGVLLYFLNQWTAKLRAAHLNLLGFAPQEATAATVTLTFVANAGGATIPAGTVVKTGAGLDAIRFTTDAELVLAPSATDTIGATCTTTGTSGNVNAGTLTRLDQPIAGLVSVTNVSAAAGGQAEESLTELEGRIPALIRTGGGRVLTTEDLEQAALEIAGIARAIAFGARGTMTAHVLLDDLNLAYFDDPDNTSNATTRAALIAAAEAATIPGVAIAVNQPTLRLVHLRRVEVKLRAGFASGTVAAAMKGAFEQYVTALDIYADDGVTLVSEAWPWGESLYASELVALFNAVAGVARIERIWVSTSEDYGATWGAETLLSEVEAWAGLGPNALYGLLQAGDDLANPLTLDLL